MMVPQKSVSDEGPKGKMPALLRVGFEWHIRLWGIERAIRVGAIVETMSEGSGQKPVLSMRPRLMSRR